MINRQSLCFSTELLMSAICNITEDWDFVPKKAKKVLYYIWGTPCTHFTTLWLPYA